MIDEQKPLEENQEGSEPLEQPQPDDLTSSATVEPQTSPEATTTEPSSEAELPILPTPEEIIAVLTEEIATLKEQADSLKSQYTRLTADFDNFRKRTTKEKEELEQKVQCKTLGELLSVIDNFERARNQIKPGNEGEMSIHKAYQGVYKNLVDSLKRLGVAVMRPEGQPFDPTYHEAMLREYTDEYPEGTVIEQLVRGYTLGDQVLRHAMVKVAAPKEPVIASEEEQPAEGETESHP